MVRTIHFHDEPEGWCEEIDSGVTEDDLAAEGDAELEPESSDQSLHSDSMGERRMCAEREASRRLRAGGDERV
jgi:hypothetical protein